MGDTSALEPGTVIAGRYRVASKIGHGGMGAVYHVHHVHTDESLALKVLHPQVLRDASVVERFRREARAPARIMSEHIARVTDADTAPDLDGAPFYVMELLRGRDLERILADDGPLPPEQVVEYLRQAARALDKAHAAGIVHRDLKPENLYLTHREDGSPCIKLLDFGIARLADTEGPATSTQVGYVFGTPNYMAPEQTTGNPEQVGPKTDIWALGLVAFKLLVGFEYFTAKTSAHLYAQILSEPLVPPSVRGSKYGAAFDAWFARCVSRNVDERYASAGEAVIELAAALDVQLAERYPSSASFPALRVSQPSIPTMHQGGASEEGSPADARSTAGPPTELPAGVPRPAPRRRRVLLVAGLTSVVGLVVGIFGVRALVSRPPEQHGLVATSTASSAGEAEPPPSVSAPATEAPPLRSSPPASEGTDAPPATKIVAPSAADTKGRAPARPTTTPTATKEAPAGLSRDQQKRLDALERLCKQHTYSPAECASKRQAIIHGGS